MGMTRTFVWVFAGLKRPLTEHNLMIELHEVSKRYGEHVALHPTTLAISPERALALIGPSGCGKSTLIRLVVGLIAPDSGSVRFEAQPITLQNRRDVRLRMGYVIQDGGLFPHLTAAQNATLMAQHLRWGRERTGKRLKELAQLTRLSPDLLDRYPAQLSGGQRQRVGLMRALMLDPEVLLLDEPLGALDPMIRSQLQEDLKEIFRRLKRTVLLVTHDMGEAAYLGDEIALMKEGRIVQKGSLDDLLQRPVDPFVTEFIRAQRPLWSAKEGAL
jgi:osmoprotectant transport system ATP-binding protein